MCENNFVTEYENILLLERGGGRSKRTKRFTIKSVREKKREKEEMEGKEEEKGSIHVDIIRCNRIAPERKD